MEIRKWFADPVWNFKLDVDTETLSKFVYNQANNNKSVHKSNRGGWQSEMFFEPTPELEDLYSQINNCLKVAQKDMGIRTNADVRLNYGWFNLNPPHAWNVRHLHPKSLFSGAFYVKVPEGNCGSIEFYRNPIVLSYMDQSIVEEWNDISSMIATYPAEENRLLIFPSWMEHAVTPNFTNEDRISFSFNTEHKVYL